MMFKGRKVYAEVDEEGNVIITGGRAVIKYQLDQEVTYLARASAVKEIDENLLLKMKTKKEKEKKAPEKIPPSASLGENHDDDAIAIFTDGACEGNPGPAGIGVLLRYRNHQKEISKFIGQGTNNIAELTAIRVALQEIKDPHLPVVLYTDSAYCLGALRGAWKTKKNQTLIESIKKEMARFSNLKIVKVEGHKGIEGNEIANRLAGQALREKKGKQEKCCSNGVDQSKTVTQI